MLLSFFFFGITGSSFVETLEKTRLGGEGGGGGGGEVIGGKKAGKAAREMGGSCQEKHDDQVLLATLSFCA